MKVWLFWLLFKSGIKLISLKQPYNPINCLIKSEPSFWEKL
ncbi:hypothetical protein HMPREF9439_02796 [Parasutterella excrementihominis YIT 11859]|uniref:Uncharacterized protein n=1 Tax=Parasutterella excrementihominis YIT 11859 TaxID=762966 RepID=F3QPA0_9BURK|nr:hypothetical protein HMPREF9439_02796 [Parasutterella excrementihominis YIT 11859]